MLEQQKRAIMFIPIKFKTSVQLAPVELKDDFDGVIMEKLRRNLEGICSRYGYIKVGSLEIVKRSAGKLMKQHFNGFIQFTVICKGDVCNPVKDSIIKAHVVNKNALGILAESYIDGSSEPVLDIIVPKKTAGIVSEIDVEDISIGDDIFVRVIGKRFQLNDKKISIIGKVVAEKAKTDVAGTMEAEGDEEGADSVDEVEGGDEDAEDAAEDDDDGGGDDVEDAEAEVEEDDEVGELPSGYDDFDEKMLVLDDDDDIDDLDASASDDSNSERDDFSDA